MLLPIPYFHVVFTLPHRLNPLIRVNQRRLYDFLFQTATQTLQEFARDPKHLGAELGITAVLHTWGQTLTEHVHVHCVVTGGGLSPRRDAVAQLSAALSLCRQGPGPSLPGQVSGRAGAIAQAAAAHLCRGECRRWPRTPAWTAFRQHLYAKPWVVYAKPPWGSPEQVLKYLSRYTHRVAIANSRLVFVGDGVVRFRYKDYAAAGARPKSWSCGPRSSCAASCSTSCPPASCASVTMACWPIARGRRSSPAARQLLAVVAAAATLLLLPAHAHGYECPTRRFHTVPPLCRESLADHRPPRAPARTAPMTCRHIVPTLPLWRSSLLVTSLPERSVPVRLPPGSPFCSRANLPGTPALALPSLAPVRLLLRLVAARFTDRVTIGRSPQTR